MAAQTGLAAAGRAGGRFARRLRLAAVAAPDPAGRTYAAYGGIYVAVALVWLWLVDGVRPDRWDLVGAAVAVTGMAIIAFAPHRR